MGLTAGPVPPRVDARVKAGLLDPVDHATDCGWSTRRACRTLDLDENRVTRWPRRRQAGQLDDAPPGGHPLHGLLDAEIEAVLGLFETGARSSDPTASRPTAAPGWNWRTCRSPRCDAFLPELTRVAAIGRLSVFQFVDSAIGPDDSLTVISLDDDYSFGVLSSHLHRLWFEERCSRLKADPRYTPTTVWDSFPWPPKPDPDKAR